MEKCGFLAKATGEALSSISSRAAGQKLGGPPHRASDRFLLPACPVPDRTPRGLPKKMVLGRITAALETAATVEERRFSDA